VKFASLLLGGSSALVTNLLALLGLLECIVTQLQLQYLARQSQILPQEFLTALQGMLSARERNISMSCKGIVRGVLPFPPCESLRLAPCAVLLGWLVCWDRAQSVTHALLCACPAAGAQPSAQCLRCGLTAEGFVSHLHPAPCDCPDRPTIRSKLATALPLLRLCTW
jgi:hypothetical protein